MYRQRLKIVFWHYTKSELHNGGRRVAISINLFLDPTCWELPLALGNPASEVQMTVTQVNSNCLASRKLDHQDYKLAIPIYWLIFFCGKRCFGSPVLLLIVKFCLLSFVRAFKPTRWVPAVLRAKVVLQQSFIQTTGYQGYQLQKSVLFLCSEHSLTSQPSFPARFPKMPTMSALMETHYSLVLFRAQSQQFSG